MSRKWWRKRQLPRVDVVFRLGQCDKENHGWREGQPLTVPSDRAFTLRQSQFQTKKEHCFALLTASPSLTTLAGNCRRSDRNARFHASGKVDISDQPRRSVGVKGRRVLCLRLTLSEPSQCPEAGQKTILASPCENKPRQPFDAHSKRTPRKTIAICATVRSRYGIFRGASSKEAAIIHPLRLDELELPPEIGSDKSKHQSPLSTIVFENSIGKRRSIRGSTANHPVDAHYAGHIRVAWVHPANVRTAGCVIADRVVFLEEKGIVSPWVCAEFRIIVQRT
jgi:hypothetical protein